MCYDKFKESRLVISKVKLVDFVKQHKGRMSYDENAHGCWIHDCCWDICMEKVQILKSLYRVNRTGYKVLDCMLGYRQRNL